MEPFMNEDFLLSTHSARRLYHGYAEKMPIIDYHCHISPEDIAKDRRYNNITEIWLKGDHYKWRLMRACGISESKITGDSSDYDKFLAFASVLPQAIGNPVYHWTHLELKRYFDCDLPLSEKNAEKIWNICNEKLHNELTVRNIILKSNVAGIITTDDPADSLEWHEFLSKDKDFPVAVKPAWRPDSLLAIDKVGFADYLKKLGSIKDMASLRNAILKRMDFFDSLGCKASDHGIISLEYVSATESELNTILTKALSYEAISNHEVSAYQYSLLKFMGAEYAKRSWVMEIHYGTIRNVNKKYFEILGADTGYDAIAASVSINGLPKLLDSLNSEGTLPKTILFSLNPVDNAMLNTLCGCFQAEGVKGKVQQGAAWWFNDSKSGMIEQITCMASLFPLGSFLGMVTDSRSFLSYTRHEYFRRILCDIIGKWVENGEYPDDFDYLGDMIENICHKNVKKFFEFF